MASMGGVAAAFFCPPGWLLGLLALGAGAAWAAGRPRKTTRMAPATRDFPSPLELAQRRLAGGEITPDQYEEIRAHLRES